MQRTLNRNRITMVEAVYLCIIKKQLSQDVENALVNHIYNKDVYMYIYLCWLLNRWYPMYAQYVDHLPRKFSEELS